MQGHNLLSELNDYRLSPPADEMLLADFIKKEHLQVLLKALWGHYHTSKINHYHQPFYNKTELVEKLYIQSTKSDACIQRSLYRDFMTKS